MPPQFLCQCSVLGLSPADHLTCKLMFLMYSVVFLDSECLHLAKTVTFFYFWEEAYLWMLDILWYFSIGSTVLDFLYCDFLLLPTEHFELWPNILDILLFVSCWSTIVPLFKHLFDSVKHLNLTSLVCLSAIESLLWSFGKLSACLIDIWYLNLYALTS